MTTLTDFSKTNVANTLAVLVAAKLLAAGYLVYWHRIDAVQTPTAWHYQYFANQETYLADSGYAAEVAAAKGLITILGDKSAIPRWITRPTSSGRVSGFDTVPVPALSVAVADIVTDSQYELGSKLKWRARPVLIEAYARDETEQGFLSDSLLTWLDGDTHLDVLNHDDTSLDVVGPIDVDTVSVDSVIDADADENMTYEVVFNARLVFVA